MNETFPLHGFSAADFRRLLELLEGLARITGTPPVAVDWVGRSPRVHLLKVIPQFAFLQLVSLTPDPLALAGSATAPSILQYPAKVQTLITAEDRWQPGTLDGPLVWLRFPSTVIAPSLTRTYRALREADGADGQAVYSWDGGSNEQWLRLASKVTGSFGYPAIVEGWAGGSLSDLYPSTMVSGAITAGTATVTPGSMAGIAVGDLLLVGTGDLAEIVTVTAATTTTFTATFANSHLAGAAVHPPAWLKFPNGYTPVDADVATPTHFLARQEEDAGDGLAVFTTDTQPPGGSVTGGAEVALYTSPQSMTYQVFTDIQWDSTGVDEASYFDAGHRTYLTVPADGWYAVSLVIQLQGTIPPGAPPPTELYDVGAKIVGGAKVLAQSLLPIGITGDDGFNILFMSLSGLARLTAADHVSASVWHNGNTVDVISATLRIKLLP